jgi:hypothetical protein
MNRSLFRLGLVTALALAMCAGSSLAFAQGGTTSTLNGTVVDTSGAVLPGATVSAKHSTTGVVTTAVANTEGAFSLPAMPIGTYVVNVTLEGFKTAVINNVVLTSTQGANVKATLEVGGVTELVTVASTSEIIQTQSTTISSTINTNQITKLPLTSRSAMDFVNFLPGVSTPGGNRDATINGLPQGVINITLDGINIQDNTNRSTDGFFAIVSPRLDAIEEVSVTTAGQGADAGQGAVQIKFVTRSGGNSYTGSGYHYYRNDKLNANTWFNNRAGNAKPKLLQNQMGARLGGPLQIPGLFGPGKAFFFGNYEELRQPSDTSRQRNLLTAGAQAGNYSYGGQTVNVLQLGLNNASTAATSTPDPTISKLLSDIRSAAGSGGGLESLDPNIDRFTFNVPVQSMRRFPTARVDYNITDNHRFTSAFNYNWFTDAPDTLNGYDQQWPGFPVAAGQTSIRLSLSNTLRSTLGRNFVNEARVGYSGAPVKFFDELSPEMYSGSLANQKGMHLNFPSIGSQLTPASVNGPSPQSRNATDLALEDTVTWLRGNHNLTGGVSWTGYNVWLKNSSLVPRVTFGLLTTDPASNVITSAALQAATGVAPNATQLAAAQNLYAFLTGRMTAIQADARLDEGTGEYEYIGLGIQRSSMKESGIFVQDSWRIRPNLTINAGLRYDVQFPFTASNSSYSTPTLEDVCGKSGLSTASGREGVPVICNLFQPGVMPGKQNPQFFNLEKGQHAYNTDWDNVAPNFGIAWTPAKRGGVLGALMSDEFVLRGGYARAYSRNGMGDFTGQYNSNPGVVIRADRTSGLTGGNSITSTTGGAAPVLFRNDANLAPGTFAATPVYPLSDVVTEDIRMFDPNIQIPYADSWTAGIQRKLTTNMALEVRYVGTRSGDAWTNRDFNEVNILENGFLNEFRRAQANLAANIAAGRGSTFAYTGEPGTTALPILLAHFNAQPTANAGNASLYQGTNWTNATFLSFLASQNPNPFGFASRATTGTASNTALIGNATFRNNALAAGLAPNFFIANPDLIGGAFVTVNAHKTKYNALQIELRRRLAQGLQFQTSYVFGNTTQTVFNTHRRELFWQRDAGTPGDLTHQFKANVVYDLPFGQGRRFVSGAGSIMERIVGGWQIGITTRVQSGRLIDAGGVRLVGWTADDVQKAFKLRFDDAGKAIYMWPQDVIDNTIRAFSVSATSATGYSGAAPEGRYFAPQNTSACIVDATADECPGVIRSLILTGPLFQQSDLRVSKRTKVVGRVNVEFAAEALNVFNTANFVPVTSTSTTLSNWAVTGLTGTNTSRVIQIVSRVNW